MRRLLSTVVLLSAVSLHAGVYVPPSPRPVFPDDFKPVTCAPTTCPTFQADDFRSAAFRFLGLSTDTTWFDVHDAELRTLMDPLCQKRNACLATPGNGHMFCDDLITPAMRSTCDIKYPKDTNGRDWEQCMAWVETFALGMTQQTLPAWREAQECAKPTAVMHVKQPDLWMAPEKIPVDYDGYFTIFTLDPDTHIPVFGHLTWQDQIVYAPANPTGETATYYPIKGPIKPVRVPNADGHTDVVPPMVTASFDYYPTMQFRLPMVIPKLKVEVERDPKMNRPGKHTFKVTTTDADSGKPVELQVMLGGVTIGETNKPLTIERVKGEKLPEIWVTSLFDRYSDVMITPAEK